MPFKTEAFVLEEINSDFKLETVELDDPQDEEVLVEGMLYLSCILNIITKLQPSVHSSRRLRSLP